MCNVVTGSVLRMMNSMLKWCNVNGLDAKQYECTNEMCGLGLTYNSAEMHNMKLFEKIPQWNSNFHQEFGEMPVWDKIVIYAKFMNGTYFNGFMYA